MAKKWTHYECFERYNTRPSNIRWSWSARSDDGRTVAVTLWQDRFERGGTAYSPKADALDIKWIGSPGHKELVDNLKWARDHCDGEFRVIIAVPKDPAASPRSIKECFPHERLKMRIIHIDDGTGDFLAERIEAR